MLNERTSTNAGCVAMNIYLFCFWLGAAGFILMLVLGFGHFHGFKAAPLKSHGSHVHGSAPGGNAAARHVQTPAFKARARDAGSFLTLLLSPRTLFMLLLGFGACGLLGAGHIPALPLVLLSAFAALLLELFLVQPMTKILFRFASEPARTLEHSILTDAEAVTAFNANGEGIVRFHLDGQVVQMLAQVSSDGLEALRVRAGDRLSIIAVDARRNRCMVARGSISLS